jgi:hypothetical protein
MEGIRMSLKKLLCLVALLSGFTLAGCAVLQPEELKSCTADEFCPDDSVCHPLARVCVKSCASPTDCPDTAKSCTGVSGAKMFCECQSTELCDGDETIICTSAEKVCAPKCTNDVDCTFGRRCDTSTGNCAAQ